MRATTTKKQRSYKKGLIAEWLAAAFLLLKGYRTIAKRYRNSCGEIDLIVRKRKIICFVEVKFRVNHREALYSIKLQQQKRIKKAAQIFIADFNHKKNIDCFEYRFDVVILTPYKSPLHIMDAFR